MSTEHTPGPYHVCEGTVVIAGGTGPSFHDGVFVVDCFHDGSVSMEEQKANAKLIAAAPQLLEACRVMRDYVTLVLNESDRCWNDWTPSYTVDAAIAAATE